MRKQTRLVKIGDRVIGGDNPILVQSMTNTKTEDVEATVKQILDLQKAGCEIVRVAVPNMEAAQAISEIKSRISIPLVADIHFDHRLALAAIEAGVDKLRLNPGNIGSKEKVAEVVEAAKEKQIPIRIGVNGGSLSKEMLVKHGSPTALAMVESAMEHVKILEDLEFYDIIISLKSSDIKRTVDAFDILSKKVDYPLHVGLTEAGTRFKGTIKSSIGIGAILLKGLGDTIRVSLTDDPCEEIKVGKEILNMLGLRHFGVEFISCPTCGRTNIDLIKLACEVEEALAAVDKNISVAVMGCAVNGPGEAKDADIGIAGGVGEAIIFKKGQLVKKVKEEDILECLLEEIDKM